MKMIGYRAERKSVLDTEDEKMAKVFAAVMDSVEYEHDGGPSMISLGAPAVEVPALGEPQYMSVWQLLHGSGGAAS